MESSGTGRSEFARLLRAHRDRRHWSQERCAAESEIDHSLVSRLEADQRVPTRLSIRKLAAGLCLTEAQRDELLMAAGYLPDDPAATIADDGASLALHRFLRDENIPERVRAAVREAVDKTLSAALIALRPF